MRTVVGDMTDEEWTRTYDASIMFEALERNPTAFSKEATIAIVREHYAAQKAVVQRMNIRAETQVDFDIFVGSVVEVDA